MHPSKRDLPRVIGAEPPASAGGLEDIFAGYQMSTAAGDLVKNTDGTLGFRQFKLTATGLQIPESATEADWQEFGEVLGRMDGAIQWWIGDWLLAGEQRYGIKYERALEITRLSYKRLRNIASVARKITLSRRRDNLTFEHHAIVAARPPEEANTWLERAAANGWSVAELREAMRPKAGVEPWRQYRRVFKDVVTAIRANDVGRIKREQFELLRELVDNLKERFKE